MKINKAKNSLEPLYRKGDMFKIVRKNKDPGLMPIEERVATLEEFNLSFR